MKVLLFVVVVVALLASAVHAYNSGDCITATTTVNIRPVPGCSQGPVGTVPSGSTVTVTGAAAWGDCSGTSLEFTRIASGWVASKYFTWAACSGGGGSSGGTGNQDAINRGLDWVARGIMYSQTDYTDGYRQDCSGFVSMCHRLDRSYTTSTLPQVFHQITKDEILPGDILLTSGHVVLFEAWTDSSRTKYIGMEEQTWGRPCKRTVGIPYPYWPGYGTYTPYRKN